MSPPMSPPPYLLLLLLLSLHLLSRDGAAATPVSNEAGTTAAALMMKAEKKDKEPTESPHAPREARGTQGTPRPTPTPTPPAGSAVPSSPSPGVVARMKKRARSAKESLEFLHAHNVARGAHGMPALRLDANLTRFATAWARKRRSDCKMTHSGGPYGENMFWCERGTWTPSRIVQVWARERSSYDLKSNSCAAGMKCGHYTQIVWQSTTSLGCASMRCFNNTGYITVCEYDPPGNYHGERPFDLTLATDTNKLDNLII